MGLGAPHWDGDARGLITGLTLGTTRAHLVRAMLEAIAYQTRELVDAMQADSGARLQELRVDGGAAQNDFLMQFQADILGMPHRASRGYGNHGARRGISGRARDRHLEKHRKKWSSSGGPRRFSNRRWPKRNARSCSPAGRPPCNQPPYATRKSDCTAPAISTSTVESGLRSGADTVGGRAVIGYALTPMSLELPEMDFQRFWRRLQQIGLNAYEARSYLVLIGHPRFKALELAARSHVPRQKIYEVLDSLIEKGFAQVIQEKTKLFSAVEPSLAIPELSGAARGSRYSRNWRSRRDSPGRLSTI